MASLWHRLNPRHSLTAAVGWALTFITLVAAIAASVWFASIAQHHIEAEIGAIFRQYATQISNELDLNLYARLQWIRAIATIAGDDTKEPTAHESRFLNAFHRALPDVAWMGVADRNGCLTAVSGAVFLPLGADVSGERWFIEGLKAPWLGDAPSLAPSASAPTPSTAGMDSIVDLSAPIRDGKGKLIGVMGAKLTLGWIRSLETSLTDSLRANRSVETLLVARDGLVMLGPKSLIGRRIEGEPQALIAQALKLVSQAMAEGKEPPSDATSGQVVTRWPDGRTYLAGFAVSDGSGGGFPGGNGWTVWVRESVDSAFAPARALETRILGAMALFGMLTAGIGVFTVRRLTRRLAAIARSADDIREGSRRSLDVPEGKDEATRIGQSLQQLLDELDRRKDALEKLNAELDQRIAARTREVERMAEEKAEENRDAAVVRERLRMARDLHDTLARSMLILLTEIRLMRKLVDMNPAALKEELAHAEAAAQEGLQEARAAIGQLRHDAVLHIGLGAGIKQLVTRTQERLGIAANCMIDPECEEMADSRAKMLFQIAEEALRNIGRHAHARNIEVSLKCTCAIPGGGPASLELRVADNGVGFDPASELPEGHYGLRGMREQADLLHAMLSIESHIGRGTCITITAPI